MIKPNAPVIGGKGVKFLANRVNVPILPFPSILSVLANANNVRTNQKRFLQYLISRFWYVE